MRRAQKKSIVVTAAFALLAALVPVASSASPVHAAGPPVFINEIHYDNVGADAGEAIEVAGPAGTDLSGWTVVLYNGNGGAPYTPTINLSGTIPDQQAGFGTLSFAQAGIQNGSPDGLALVDATGINVVEFLSYEGTFTAVGGAANGMISTDIGVAEDGAGAVGDSLQLTGSGTGGGDFAWTASAPSSFGAPNTGQTFVTPTELTVDCGASVVTDEGVPASTTVSAVDGDDEIASISLVSTTVPGTSLTAGAANLPGGVGVAASLDLDLDGLAPVGSYTATIEASNASGDVTGCDVLIDVESTVVVITPIHDVQGPGSASPLVGQTVVIEGVVVSDFQDGTDGTSGDDLNGFHVQEEDADVDADAATSEGIFVFDDTAPAVDVTVGDLVQVEGVVAEFFNLTELTDPVVTVVSSGNPLPTPAAVALPVTSTAVYEPIEGMRVSFAQNLVISEYFNYDRFGELVLTSQRRLTPTAQFEPGPAAIAAAAAYELDSITLDDGRSSQNPDPARHPDGGVFDLTNLFRGGDTLTDVTGVVDYAFGAYRIQPTQGATHNEANPRTAAPDPVGGSLDVATFNVLNYFTTLDDGTNDICGPAANQECRGADNAEELARQRAKIVAAMAAIDADVLGLIEIENNVNDGPTADLVAGLNDLVGAGTYDYVPTGAFGTDAIRQAFIYKPASVTPLGDFALLDASVDPRFNDEKNRPALAQAFEDNATGAVVTIAVNHFKSKGSDCNDVGDPDTGDGSGNCNLTRAAAAAAVADWLAGDPTGSGDSDALIIGDLNSYDKEFPIDVLKARGYQDLVFDHVGEDAYSYVFDGQIGYLDYQLANASLAGQVTGTTVWNINADEPDALDYDTSFKKPNQDAIYAPDPYRSSDHDPVIVGLELTTTARQAKGHVIVELTAALSSDDGRQGKGSLKQVDKDDRYIRNAIQDIENSLMPTYWEDGDHLTSRGDRVFDAERDAVRELERVRGTAKPVASAAIADLVGVDADLARTAIDEAVARGGSSRDIERAESAMRSAERAQARGDSSTAIRHYESAWEFAGRSVKNLVDLQLLGFNDYHGNLEANTPGNVNGTPAGGAEYLSAKLTQLRAGNDNSFTVAAGDLIGGSPAFSGLFHDEPSVESLNAMHLDVSGVGNHEFDEGVTELLRMQNGGCHPVDGCYFPDEPFAGADFKWLAANVVNETTGDTPLPPYEIKRVDGIEVAFIGMTLEATDTLVAAAGIQGWDFRDEAETANALVPILKRQGVEAIVVLLHEGGSQTPPPGAIDACVGISGPIVAINNALDPEIDALITGHTHLPYNCTLPDSAGVPRLVSSAYSYGRVVTEMNLVLDKKTKDVLREFSTATNHLVDQNALNPDPVQTAVIAKWQPLFDAAGNDPVGSITADITRGGTPPGTDRGVESAAGNLIADAQLWATSSNFAEIAFMNPGGVRSDLTFAQSGTEGDGVVTYGEAFTFQPFGNTLVTYALTGAQIISVLEEQCQPLGSSRPFLHLGVSQGFSYDLATTIAAGNCTAITVSNVQLNGVALNPTQEYQVTVNNFLADGGDNFTTLGEVTSSRLDGGNDLQALINYMQTFSPLDPPSTDRANELP